jgi:hypothetical protein
LDAGLTSLLCKKIIVAKTEEVKTECKVGESSKEGCGSKWAVCQTLLFAILTVSL